MLNLKSSHRGEGAHPGQIVRVGPGNQHIGIGRNDEMQLRYFVV